jgi:hypothetical protein
MTSLVVRPPLREPADWLTGPFEVDLNPDTDTLVEHQIGRKVGFVVLGATGPASYWTPTTADPYNVLAIRASAAVTARIALV